MVSKMLPPSPASSCRVAAAAGCAQTDIQANTASHIFHKYEAVSTTHFLSIICSVKKEKQMSDFYLRKEGRFVALPTQLLTEDK